MSVHNYNFTVRIVIPFLALFSFVPLMAQESGEVTPESLYSKGSFAEAANAAEREGSSTHLAFAARSLLAKVICAAPGEGSIDDVLRAQSLAQQSLTQDPQNVEGHVQAIVSLGFEARYMGKWSAHFKGLGQQGKKLLKTAYELAPHNPWVLSAYGGWHLEIADKAGRRRGRWLYGAKIDEGIAYFEEALRLAPHNISMRHQFSLLLLSLDAKKYKNKVEKILSEVESTSASNYFEEVSKKRSVRLQEVLALGNKDDLETIVKLQSTHFKKK